MKLAPTVMRSPVPRELYTTSAWVTGPPCVIMLGEAWSRPGVSGLRRLELCLDGTMVTEVIWDLAGTHMGAVTNQWC